MRNETKSGMSANIHLFKYFVSQINIFIRIISFLIFKYIWIFALWSKYSCKCFSACFVPFPPKYHILSAYFQQKKLLWRWIYLNIGSNLNLKYIQILVCKDFNLLIIFSYFEEALFNQMYSNIFSTLFSIICSCVN